MEALKIQFNYLWMSIASALAPSLKELLIYVKDWVKVNKKYLIKQIKTIAIGTKQFIVWIIHLFKRINEVVISTIGWGNALKALGIAYIVMKLIKLGSILPLLKGGVGLITASIRLLGKAFTTLFVTNPLGVILLLIGAMAFAVYEFVGYIQGKDNLFAKWAKSSKKFKIILESFRNPILVMKMMWLEVLNIVDKLFLKLYKLPLIGKMIKVAGFDPKQVQGNINARNKQIMAMNQSFLKAPIPAYHKQQTKIINQNNTTNNNISGVSDPKAVAEDSQYQSKQSVNQKGQVIAAKVEDGTPIGDQYRKQLSAISERDHRR